MYVNIQEKTIVCTEFTTVPGFMYPHRSLEFIPYTQIQVQERIRRLFTKFEGFTSTLTLEKKIRAEVVAQDVKLPYEKPASLIRVLVHVPAAPVAIHILLRYLRKQQRMTAL